jgi:hypothetical protein
MKGRVGTITVGWGNGPVLSGAEGQHVLHKIDAATTAKATLAFITLHASLDPQLLHRQTKLARVTAAKSLAGLPGTVDLDGNLSDAVATRKREAMLAELVGVARLEAQSAHLFPVDRDAGFDRALH